MTQSNARLNAAQIRHQRNKRHLEMKGRFHPHGTGYSDGPRWSGIGSHSPSTKVAYADLLHVDKTGGTNGLFQQNNNSLFHLKRSGRASPPCEPLLTSNTGNVGKIPCSAHLEVLSGLTCSGAEQEEDKHLPIWQLTGEVSKRGTPAIWGTSGSPRASPGCLTVIKRANKSQQ